MRLDEVIARIRSVLPTLQGEHHVLSVGVCGSVARGEENAGSDIDVVVRFDPNAQVTLFTLARVHRVFEQALGPRVDVIDDHERLRPEFRDAIRRDLVDVA